MQTFLIITNESARWKSYINAVCEKEGVEELDRSFLEFEGTIGIEEVRNIQKTIFLKPLRGNKKTIIIANVHTATIEAQNAMLKFLEEPPQNTFVFLTAATANLLLPTVLSRCQIIKLTEQDSYSTEKLTELKDTFNELNTWSVEKKLLLAQNLAIDKQKAIIWISDMIFMARSVMLENLSESNIFTIEQLQNAYQQLTTTNINTRFLLENTLLGIKEEA